MHILISSLPFAVTLSFSLFFIFIFIFFLILIIILLLLITLLFIHSFLPIFSLLPNNGPSPPSSSRRPSPPSQETLRHTTSSPPSTPKASDALPLPLYLTNTIFFTLFFSVAYYLLHRWRDKIRSSTPLHLVTFPELAAILSLIASFIYLLGFFGIDFVQSFIARSSTEEDDDIHHPLFHDVINLHHQHQIPKLPPPILVLQFLALLVDIMPKGPKRRRDEKREEEEDGGGGARGGCRRRKERRG